MAKRKKALKPRAKKQTKKTVAARASVKSTTKKKPVKRKTVAAKATVKSTAAKKAPAKKPVAGKAKSHLAFAKTNKPVTPMRARPLSPHLGIYRPQITSVLSIMHRGTGVALYFAAFALAALIICLGYGPKCFSAALALLDNCYGCIALYGLLFCVFYHLCNGIRHLAWDAGKGFALSNVTLSGLVVITTALSLTIAIWMVLHPGFMEQFKQ